MKQLKLIIALLVVVAIGSGLTYYFTRAKATGSVEPSKSEIKTTTVEKNIKEKIEDAPNSRFCTSACDEIHKQIDLFFSEEPTNRNTYILRLQGAYTQKFIQQANYVFDRRAWKHSDISTIRKELNRCLVFSPDNAELKSISKVLREYDNLYVYKNRVDDACRQRPKCLRNPNALYMDDDWNINTTNDLINSVPNVTTKAKNAPIYQQTRKHQVEEQLKRAHRKFIDDKLECAEKEAIGYNYNKSRHKDWETMSAKLYVNFKTYVFKWGGGKTIGAEWQTKVANMEKYTIPQNSHLTPTTNSLRNY